MTNMMKEIFYFINEERIIKGYNQGDFAHACGITESAYSHYMKGDRCPSFNTICAMLDVLGYEIMFKHKDAEIECKVKENLL